MPNPIRGIIPAVVTPFREDELIDYTAWQGVIEMLIANGVHGLFVIGGQGEFFALDQEEREVATRFCVQTVAKRIPVYANVGAVTTKQAVRLAQKAQADGVDYIVAVTPYYLQPSPAELVEHYLDICRSVTLPVLAYNIPERTQVQLTPAILRQLRSQENFVGLKDSSGKLEILPEYVNMGLSVFMGRDHMILDGLKLGCVGAVTACSNVCPKAFVDLYNAYTSGNIQEAQRLQALVEPLRKAFGLHTFPAVVKEAMKMAGVPAGLCRRPVGPMPVQARAQLGKIIEDLREAGYIPQPVGQRAGVE